ncbi:MAG: aminoglycoside 6-adenylyltransferase, partial [Streptosporangiaceae bacterium]
MEHERVVADVVAWAEADENIRLVVLIGSVGRGDAGVDDLSDLDVQLYVNEPGKLLADPAWHRRFGEVLVVENLPNPGWYPTRLAYYVDGKIDFIISPAGDVGVDTYDEPFRVLLDKDRVSERL